jgi:hypothetical protein
MCAIQATPRGVDAATFSSWASASKRTEGVSLCGGFVVVQGEHFLKHGVPPPAVQPHHTSTEAAVCTHSYSMCLHTFEVTGCGGRGVAGGPGGRAPSRLPKKVGGGQWAVGCTHSHPAEQHPAALAASISAHSVNSTCLLLRMHSSQALGWLLLLNTAGRSRYFHLEVLAEDGSRSVTSVSGPCLDNVLSCRNGLAGEDDRGVRWHVWGMPGSLGQANCTLGKSAFHVMSAWG